jgi:uncharacterized protein (TIGR04255 family)
MRAGGFTFSRLAPYQSWPPFRSEARRLWEVAQPVVKSEVVTRVAVRYVNRLELPLPFGDFKEYLRTVPEISPSLSQGLSAFFMQLHMPQPDISAVAVLNLRLEPVAAEPLQKSVTVILDVDLFKESEIPQNDEGLWALFEQLHVKKNEIFEACITDRTRELIR